MGELWSAEHKIVLERRAVDRGARAQRELGVDVPDGCVADYEAVVDQVDLASIAARERVTRHDVKARIEEFSALAGHEHIHKGMTSRDLTENVEQLQIRAVARAGPRRGWSPRWPGWPSGRPSTRRPGDHRPHATTSPPRPPRSASASPTRARSCCSRVRPGRRPAGPLSAARHQGPGRHAAGHARPARLDPRRSQQLEAARRRPPRVRRDC